MSLARASRMSIFPSRSSPEIQSVCGQCWLFLSLQVSAPQHRKSRFWYRYRPEGLLRILFGLILDPPLPVHMLLQQKSKFIGTGHSFPHCVAFLEKMGVKRGGTGTGFRFSFPCNRIATAKIFVPSNRKMQIATSTIGAEIKSI